MNARRGRIPLSERVYRSLQRDLAAGVLVPTERLGEERLAETYGVSRTPVREALARLYADGLLERHADGLYPYRPRVDELGDLYELRIILEARGIQRLQVTPSGPPEPASATTATPNTLASALPTATLHDMTALRHELETWRRIRQYPPAPDAALITADEQFHATLLRAAGNSALADALSAMQARVRPVRVLDIPTPGRIAAMAEDHVAIAELLLTGDLESALRTLLAHLTSSRAHVLTRARRALELTKLAQAVRE
ncbi:GntR family transcriptional regulator [Nocardia sp. CDC153]|uniref:GntR family transcriptional regulator n=1 Tax=Nocardia sp. CDC153 TaxID=3112167 RepID=UPI002DB69EAF|nr:GntR family transcriptional regulator [Nocardia sp. CDC153]MEC3951434.1 GntR family transcriptional regulator [Nocardia sp. CDC153]